MASAGNQPSGDTASRTPAAATDGLILPNELLSMIAHECDPADLKNLRLTSRLMHQVSTVPFARKYFSRRRFLLTYQSMKALVDITAHPTFGPYLTCITFGTYRLIENFCRNRGDHGDDDWAARYDITEAMHRTFVKHNHHVKMLILALKNLRKCHNTRASLGIHDAFHRNEFRRRGYAFKASYQDFDDLMVDSSTVLDAVLTAWRSSGYPLTAVKFCLSEEADSLEELALEPNSMLDSLLPDRSSGSTISLDFHLNLWQQGSYAKVKLLSKSTCLEPTRHFVGDLGQEGSHLLNFNNDQYGRIWQAIMSSPLRTISIERSDTTYQGLIELFQSHKTQLRTLKLRQIRVTTFGTLKESTLEFLRFLRDDLNLTCLEMDDLAVKDVDDLEPSMILPAPEEELVCDGREEVEEGLETLIEEVKQEYRDELSESSGPDYGGFYVTSGTYEDD
jgi:hypothetical protein